MKRLERCFSQFRPEEQLQLIFNSSGRLHGCTRAISSLLLGSQEGPHFLGKPAGFRPPSEALSSCSQKDPAFVRRQQI